MNVCDDEPPWCRPQVLTAKDSLGMVFESRVKQTTTALDDVADVIARKSPDVAAAIDRSASRNSLSPSPSRSRSTPSPSRSRSTGARDSRSRPTSSGSWRNSSGSCLSDSDDVVSPRRLDPIGQSRQKRTTSTSPGQRISMVVKPNMIYGETVVLPKKTDEEKEALREANTATLFEGAAEMIIAKEDEAEELRKTAELFAGGGREEGNHTSYGHSISYEDWVANKDAQALREKLERNFSSEYFAFLLV